ncbi:MAG: ribonuclease R [Eubacterium sp.]|nr:ribonuclease R [Eubacterium sp.]
MDPFEKQKKVVYELICDELYVPMKAKELAILLNIPKGERDALHEVLDALTAEGKIEATKKGKYHKAKQKALCGIYQAHPRGFGFVSVEGMDEDIFIPEGNAGQAMHLDEVRIKLLPEAGGKRREGVVLEIIKRGTQRLVGYYEASDNYGFVRPDNKRYDKDVFILKGKSKGAVTGHKVVVELTSYGDETHNPEGIVTEIIGHVNDPGTDIMSIVKGYELPTEFPEKVLNQAQSAALRGIVEGDLAGRRDLRGVRMVTIDGEDAKDLDDAVSLTKDGGRYKLGVHIADVANYVQEHSALDEEALKRGTSVYLADRVIPMLPHALSNGICSLNQGEDRLALSCLMEIDGKGTVIDYEIVESVIQVDARMTYTSVDKIITVQDEEEREKYKDFVPMFEQMKELADILRKKRRSRGSIDFDFPETKLILDENGRPTDIKPYDRNAATKIIEDFMLIANETVAQHYYWQEIPFVYRTHDNPDSEKIQKLALFINNFGFSLHIGQDEIHPKELQRLLEKIEGSEAEGLISRLTLRSMKQAKYEAVCSGHFGLAANYYCHFTSPIRRYPDLQIHRIIKDTLRGRMNEKKTLHYESILPNVAKQASDLERRAEEAERETVKLKKVEYMSERIGEEYTGVISGVTNYGFYVELPNTIEGMVHITALEDDYYEYLEDTYELAGETTGKRYKLGQKVRILVKGTDRLNRTIDFEVCEEKEETCKGDGETDGERNQKIDCK